MVAISTEKTIPFISDSHRVRGGMRQTTRSKSKGPGLLSEGGMPPEKADAVRIETGPKM